MKATLAKAYERRAGSSQDQLVLDNIDFVGRILSTMAFFVSDEDARENLHSAGLVGLVEAASKFDRTKGVAFRTFAFPRIRGAIVDELRKQSPVSQAVMKQIGLVRQAYEELEPPVTPESIAKKSGLTVEEVTVCLEAMRFIKPDNWNDLADVVHGSWRKTADSPDYEVEANELKNALADAIQNLPEREMMVVTLYYNEELNLAEIGRVLELSESRVSRILASAKFRLQETLRCKVM